jgi:dolichol-phosphate mannosyltransferase
MYEQFLQVPEITVHKLQPRKTRYCIVVGVWNEGERITRQIERMQAIAAQTDIIVADGGSTDGATSLEAVTGKVSALIIDKRRHGLSGQYQSAIAYAMAEGYDGVIMIDGNGKDGVEGVSHFVRELENGADLIQGSRFLPGGEYDNIPMVRYYGIRYVFNPVLNFFCRFRFTDGMNGFKGVSRRLIEHPGVQPFRDIFHYYSLQYYFNYRPAHLGLKVMEVPVSRKYPKTGQIPTKIHGLKAYYKILRELAKTCLGYYNPR